MKYVIIALVALSALFVTQHLRAEFSVPKPFSQEDLVKVASRAPDTQVLADVYFVKPYPIQNLSLFMRDAGVRLKSFTVATQTQTSGYTLSLGKDIQEAVNEYMRDKVLFSQRLLDMQGQMIISEKSTDIAKALEKSNQQIKLNQSIDIEITSIEVIGSAQAVLRWQSVNSQNVSIKHVFDATYMKQ